MFEYKCNFKYEKDKNLILGLEPVLISLFFGCVIPVIKREIPGYKPTITRTIDEKIPGVSISKTHEQGRALDIRTKDMPSESAKKIEVELNLLLAEVFGAISKRTRKPVFCYLEDEGGENEHFHIQIRPFLNIDILLKLVSRGILYTQMNSNACKF